MSNWCCDELKEAAQNWLDSIGTDKEKEAGKKYVLELQDSIVAVDGMLAFLPTDEAKAKFGEETANKFYEHAKDKGSRRSKLRLPGLHISISYIGTERRNFEISTKIKPVVH